VSRKANPTIIGGFVLGAIALVVVALAVFGSGKFFVQRPRAVAFFQGNIQGLAVGSAVNLRGVQVGAVTDIQLRLDVQTMQPVIPVYMEFDLGRLRFNRGMSAAEVAEHQPRGELAHGDREVDALHLRADRALDGEVALVRPEDLDLVAARVERREERHGVDVVPVRVRDEDAGGETLMAAARHQVVGRFAGMRR